MLADVTVCSTRTILPGLMCDCKDKTKGCLFDRGYNSQWKAKQKLLEGFSELLEGLTHIHWDDLECDDLFSQVFVLTFS